MSRLWTRACIGQEVPNTDHNPIRATLMGRHAMQEEDYVTEKYAQALVAGSVPVVIGAPNIEDYAVAPNSMLVVQTQEVGGLRQSFVMDTRSITVKRSLIAITGKLLCKRPCAHCQHSGAPRRARQHIILIGVLQGQQ